MRPSKLSTRVIAHLIDLSMVTLAYVPVVLFAEPLMEGAGFLGLSLLSSIFLLIFLGYFTLFEGLTSSTPGKRALGLRVISLNTLSKVSMEDSIVRNLLRLVDALTLYLSVLFTDGTRIGDLAAGTVVASKDLLTLELPSGRSDVAVDIRKGILEATSQELMTMEGGEELVKRLSSGVKIDELPEEVPEEVASAAFVLATRPRLSLTLLGPEKIIRIYERAAELCYHVESREILRNRVELMRALMREPPRGGFDVRRVFLEGPREFRELAPYFLLSLVIFTASLITAYNYRPAWLETLLEELFGRGEAVSQLNPVILSLLILMNNVRVALTVVGTAPAIFLAPLVLTANGALVGLVIAVSKAGPVQTLGLILPHGVPELTAIFISTSIALSAVREIIAPRSGGRLRSAGKVIRGKLEVLALALLVLVYAALVEGFVTRSIGKDLRMALLFSLVEGFVIYAYLLLVGRRG
ncbi:MAG: stage II sporulation protein M [Candidatus Korarchaeota archaeon]|nr:stage II sporulation protein M [Candidatus Korarchaeota archaeon]